MIHDFATLPKTQAPHQVPEPIRHTRIKSVALFTGGMALVFSLALGFFSGDDQPNSQVVSIAAEPTEHNGELLAEAATASSVETGRTESSKKLFSEKVETEVESTSPKTKSEPAGSLVTSVDSSATEKNKASNNSTVQTVVVPVQSVVSANTASKTKGTDALINKGDSIGNSTTSNTSGADKTAKQPVEKSKSGAVASIRASAKKEEATEWGFYEKLKRPTWPIPVATGAYVDGELAERDRPVYELQAASFKSGDDASKLIGKLAKKGLKGQINVSVSSSGQEWYRVLIGPFNHSSKLNKAQDILVSMNMMPLKRRVN